MEFSSDQQLHTESDSSHQKQSKRTDSKTNVLVTCMTCSTSTKGNFEKNDIKKAEQNYKLDSTQFRQLLVCKDCKNDWSSKQHEIVQQNQTAEYLKKLGFECSLCSQYKQEIEFSAKDRCSKIPKIRALQKFVFGASTNNPLRKKEHNDEHRTNPQIMAERRETKEYMKQIKIYCIDCIIRYRLQDARLE